MLKFHLVSFSIKIIMLFLMCPRTFDAPCICSWVFFAMIRIFMDKFPVYIGILSWFHFACLMTSEDTPVWANHWCIRCFLDHPKIHIFESSEDTHFLVIWRHVFLSHLKIRIFESSEDTHFWVIWRNTFLSHLKIRIFEPSEDMNFLVIWSYAFLSNLKIRVSEAYDDTPIWASHW